MQKSARRIQDFCLFILQWSVFQSGLQIAERSPSATALHRHVNASVSDHWPAIHSSSLSIKDFALHIIFHFISERSSLESFDMRTCVFGSMKKNVWGPPWIPEWLDAWSPFDSMRVSESGRLKTICASTQSASVFIIQVRQDPQGRDESQAELQLQLGQTIFTWWFIKVLSLVTFEVRWKGRDWVIWPHKRVQLQWKLAAQHVVISK